MTTSSSKNSPQEIGISQLRHVITAADYGSFRQASEALRLRQSTVSRSILNLEHALGICLFERLSGGIRTTPAGDEFLRVARSILSQMEALITVSKSNGRGESGKLIIGFYTSLTAGNLRATLVDFRRLFPKIELGMVERSRINLVNSLRNGALDVVVAPEGEPSFDGKVLRLWSERILLALPEGHTLSEKDAVYWTDLRQETVLLSQYDRGQELENLLRAKLGSPADRPKIERHDVSRGIIKSLISIGFGISLVVESDIGAKFAGLTYREVRDGSGPSQVSYAAHWRTANNNPALQSLIKLLGERYPLSVTG